MRDLKGQMMSMDSFYNMGDYGKKHYSGLLVVSNPGQECFNIGVQLDDNVVLVVDQAKDTNVRERIQNWARQVEDIKKKHRDGEPFLH